MTLRQPIVYKLGDVEDGRDSEDFLVREKTILRLPCSCDSHLVEVVMQTQ